MKNRKTAKQRHTKYKKRNKINKISRRTRRKSTTNSKKTKKTGKHMKGGTSTGLDYSFISRSLGVSPEVPDSDLNSNVKYVV